MASPLSIKLTKREIIGIELNTRNEKKRIGKYNNKEKCHKK